MTHTAHQNNNHQLRRTLTLTRARARAHTDRCTDAHPSTPTHTVPHLLPHPHTPHLPTHTEQEVL